MFNRINRLGDEMKLQDLKIVYAKVQCPKCNRIWGVVINGKDINTIPERYLVCDSCGNLTANFNKDKEILDNEGTDIFK